MPEKEGGLIEGVLGAGEGEEREAEETTARADDVATVVMMDAARFDPELSKKAGSYLDKQGALVDLQIRHFDEERRLAIDAAKRKRFFDHLRMSFQVFLTVVATTISVAVISLFWDAVHSSSVVIDPIEISPNVASQVPSPKIISTALLDVLSRIQAGPRTNAELRALSNAWTSDIAIEVAETGLSIGQIERTLKARFGHDQHIGGDVVLTEQDGLALTVRGTGILAKTFTDDKRNLDRLLTEAGEYIYGQSQPGLWTNYLSNNGRSADAIQFAESAYATVAASEKPYVLVYWANALADKGDLENQRTALTMYQEAVRLKPDFWYGYNVVTFGYLNLGDEEGAVRSGEQQMRVAGGRPGRSPEILYRNYDPIVGDFLAYHNALIADLDAHSGIGTISAIHGNANLFVATTEASLHDVSAATLHNKTIHIDEKVIVNVLVDAQNKALIAEEVGDIKTAAKDWDAYIRALSTQSGSDAASPQSCLAAPTYEKSGQSAKANAALYEPKNASDVPTSVDCNRFKGDVLELRGDWAGAQVWYAKAEKLGPSIPFGYYSFGMALVKHGDLNGAAEKFKQANLKGPHWADPLKAWGDVLMKQGQQSEALDKYDAALKYAPNWIQLKVARAEAAKVKS